MPLAELQYRGAFWSQVNHKDWTTLAFMQSADGGLGLDVARDNATLDAMKTAIWAQSTPFAMAHLARKTGLRMLMLRRASLMVHFRQPSGKSKSSFRRSWFRMWENDDRSQDSKRA